MVGARTLASGRVLARWIIGLVAAGLLGWYAVLGVGATLDLTTPEFDERWRGNHEHLECLDRRLHELVPEGTVIYTPRNSQLHHQRFGEWSVPTLRIVTDEADADVRVEIVTVPDGACTGQDIAVTELG